jgi:arylsulfatase A-like enzyme
MKLFLMNRNILSTGLLFILPFLSCNISRHPDKPLPNIVLIVADDLGYGDFSCYGATKISTPAIDTLASEGMRFTDAYAASSLCSPSRYSILTGRYSWRSRLKEGVLPFFAQPLIAKNKTTLAAMLKQKGYYTVCIGKWHLGMDWALKTDTLAQPDKTVFDSWGIRSQDYIDFSKPVKEGPVTRGFDYFFGMAGSLNMLPFVFIENDHVVQAPRNFYQDTPVYNQYNMEAPDWDAKTVNQVLTKKAVETIDKHFATKAGQPLFLYFPTSAIHQSCLPTFTRGKSRAGLRGDMVMEFDWSVSEVVKALKRNHAFKNTLLIITSDNGPRPGDPALTIERYKRDTGKLHSYYLDYFNNYKPELKNPYSNKAEKAGWFTYGHKASGDLLGFKTDAWEGGLRIPLIVVWQNKINSGKVNRHLVCLTDLMATLADVTGYDLKKGEGEDSYSFYKNLLGADTSSIRASAVLSSGGSGAFVVRQGYWKYIEGSQPTRWGQTYYPEGPWVTQFQLYNLKKDEAETNNLYQSMPQKAAALKNIIAKVKAHEISEEDK